MYNGKEAFIDSLVLFMENASSFFETDEEAKNFNAALLDALNESSNSQNLGSLILRTLILIANEMSIKEDDNEELFTEELKIKFEELPKDPLFLNSFTETLSKVLKNFSSEKNLHVSKVSKILESVFHETLGISVDFSGESNKSLDNLIYFSMGVVQQINGVKTA